MDTQEAYQNAMDALKAKDYKAAERAFKIAFESTPEILDQANNGQYNNIQSYYGLTQVINSNENGLLLCRDAASKETYDGDVFLNLACAELESDNRKRAIEAIQQGMKIEPHNARVRRACAMLDCRKKCCLGFMPRQHRLNHFFGRFRRRPREEITVHGLLYE